MTAVYWDVNKDGIYDSDIDQKLYEGAYCTVYIGQKYDIDEAKVTVNGGKVGYIYGGFKLSDELTLTINESNIVVNGGTVSYVCGGSIPYGESYVTTKKSNIIINGGLITGVDISGLFIKDGMDTIEESYITINGGRITRMYFLRGSYSEAGNYVGGTSIYYPHRRTVNKSTLELNGGSTGYFDGLSSYNTKILISGGAHYVQSSSSSTISYQPYSAYNNDGQKVHRVELKKDDVPSFVWSKLKGPENYNINGVTQIYTNIGIIFWLPEGEQQLTYDGIIYKANVSDIYIKCSTLNRQV